ncbi:MAG: transglutaminase-like cysteine peptidase [Pseudomonadota bacterium]|nr:transglutaminase-like cysteine peptidase [Pseudomonadota bacterium]
MNRTATFGIAALAAFASLALTGAASARTASMVTTGTTSQPIGHYEFCQRYRAACQPQRVSNAVPLTGANWKTLVEVNNAVNTSIFPREDMAIHGKADVWSYPTSEGDCEDYVLLKQYMLQQAGFPTSALLITVVLQSNGEGHAVLTVRTDKGDMILDNLADQVRPWYETEYLYLKRQSERNAGEWVGISDDRSLLVGSLR